MAHNVEITVKWRGDSYYVVTTVDGKYRDSMGPFATLGLAKEVADDLAWVLTPEEDGLTELKSLGQEADAIPDDKQ